MLFFSLRGERACRQARSPFGSQRARGRLKLVKSADEDRPREADAPGDFGRESLRQLPVVREGSAELNPAIVALDDGHDLALLEGDLHFAEHLVPPCAVGQRAYDNTYTL